jgi:cytochrome c556
MLTLFNSAYAHGGATGIVKERMDAMSSMADSMKALTPMMRGKTEYDAENVRALATRISEQAGGHLLAMFPEGSLSEASEAKPSIWTKWDRFETYANELSVLAAGLSNAADNVNAGSEAGGVSDMGSMMGNGMGGGMMGSAPKEMITIEMLSEMPATAVFRKLNQNCTACHSEFRSEKK